MPDPLASSSLSLSTFWQAVLERAADRPERPAFAFLADGEREAERLSYGALDLRARAVAAALRERLEPAARALLLLPPGLDFVAAFLGCLYAGVVAVPAYPPRPGRGEGRLRALLEDARPGIALVGGGAAGRTARRLAELAGSGAGAPDWLDVGAVPDAAARRWRPPADDPDAVAFLQYTSGSTAAPRGVEVTHRSLVANERAIAAAFGQSEDSVVVGWLPLYHDMGLIGNVLQPLWSGGSAVLMSPAAFLQRPRRWLEAIARYRATTSGGPDFAYALTARKVPPAERAGLDLASWRVAFSGAEPVRADTLERFAEAFAPCGFRRQAFLPCYGLAEATLFVSGERVDRAPVVERVAAAGLEAGRALPPAAAELAVVRRLVGCGRPPREIEVRVVDPERRVLRAAGEVGEIWIAGESIARGYFRRPRETAAVFGARLAGDAGAPGGEAKRYLRTGDLGYLSAAGELVVTGRLKDLLIVRGRNLYPQDLERSAEESHPALRPAGAAAFSVEAGGEERVVLVCEVEARREGEAGAAAAAARAAVAAEHEAAVAAVVAIRAGALPRTSSGKVRRRECRRQFLASELRPLALVGDQLGEGFGEAAEDEAAGAGPGALLAEGAAAPSREDLLALAPPARSAAAAAYLAEVARRLGLPVAADGAAGPLILDSLQAVELRNRVAADLAVELPLERLLEGGSFGRLVAGLVRDLEAAADEGDVPTAWNEGSVAVAGDRHPLTAGQRALWLLERLGPDGRGARGAYTVAFAARLMRPGGADPGPEELRRALEALVARHPALRTVYPAVAGEPEARVLPAARPPGDGSLDFRLLTPIADAASLRRRLSDEAARPFDLERGPVVRARLVPGPGAPVLLLAVHHAALDLWSLELLLEDLARLLAGGAALLPPVPFAAFARWQEELLAGPTGAELRAFWRAELAGAPAVLELPADRPRPPAPSLAGARVPFALPPAAADGARQLAGDRSRGCGSTLYAVLLAAFAALLARLTGRDELLVGSPAAGRSRSELEGVVGYLANLLPIRAELAGDPSFAELLARMRRRAARALERQDLPFPVLVEELAPPRDRSRHPLVQAAFVLERPHRLRQAGAAAFVLGRDGARVELGPVTLEAVALEQRAVQLDLMLVAAEAGGALAVALDYATDLFDPTTAGRWARSFGVLLAAAAANPGRRLSELPLLGRAERFQLLAEWNDTAEGRLPAETVHALVAERARRSPDAVALVADDAVALVSDEAPGDAGRPRAVSYGELRRRALGLAGRLRRAGAGPERGVAVELERSPELVVALLAVLEAGSFYVPLDRELPPARRAAMVAATRPVVIVDEQGSLQRPSPGQAPSEVAGPAGAAAPSLPDSLAYVLFTSGSTGEPKAIAVPHRAVVRLVARPGYARLGPDDAVLQLAPVSFDASTFEIWGALAAGAGLVVAPPGPVAADRLAGLLARHRVTTLWLTAGLFHLVIDERPGAFAPLRQLLAGGDVLSPERVRRALRSGRSDGRSDIRLIDGYGPTEGTTFSACHAMADPDAVPSPVPIGRPIGGTRVHLADARLGPVPLGVPGELLIGGSGLARGYHGRPARTAERFVPDPFSGEPGARLYRTGDLARWGPDGALRFLGRLDAQVKVRGFRVEPEEVEGVLLRCPGVREAVVARRGDALAAWLVPQGEGRPAVAALRERLAAELPGFMVPAAFTFVDALPLGPTGKVDRSALPDPAARAGAISPAAARRPRSELERTLAGLWAEALDLDAEAVDPEASFFELGGHSLQVVRLHARLTEALGREIPIVELFDHPSVASLAAHLGRRSQPGPAAAPPAAEDRAAARRDAMSRRRAARRLV
jgi:amino acid adenylation domain-containing protein